MDCNLREGFIDMVEENNGSASHCARLCGLDSSLGAYYSLYYIDH